MRPTTAFAWVTLLVALSSAGISGADDAAPAGLLPVPDYTGDLLHRSHLTGHDSALPNTDTAVLLGARLNLAF